MPSNPFVEVNKYFEGDRDLSEYVKNFDAIKESGLQNRPMVGEGVAGIRDKLQAAIFEQIYFNLLTAAKLKYIFSGASDCFERENVIGLAFFSRAVLEHTAFYAVLIKKLESTIEKLNGQNDIKVAKQYLNELSGFYHSSYYGSGNRNKGDGNKTKPIHIHDAIKVLDGLFGEIELSDHGGNKVSGHSFLFQHDISRSDIVKLYGIPIEPFPKTHIVRSDYDFLCDFVHPNYGSNFLVTSGTFAQGQIDTPNEPLQNLNILFVKKCLRYWLYYKELRAIDVRANIKLYSWLGRSEQRGVKASRIFSKKSPKYLGDGRTLESAYYFPNARDKAEEFEMFSFLLSNLRIEKYKSSVVDVSEKNIVDKIVSDDGKQFFVKWRLY